MVSDDDLLEAIADALDADPDGTNRERPLTQEEVGDIALELESRFSIYLTPEEELEVTTVGEMLELAKRKLAEV